jgi:hypothetical protein
MVSSQARGTNDLPDVQVAALENQKEKSKVIEPNENTEVQPNEGFQLAAPKTPAELIQAKKDLETHTAQAITDLKAKRQAIVDGAKAAFAQAKVDAKKVDEDLRYLGAKRAFKARGPRKTAAPATAPATTKKKGK